MKYKILHTAYKNNLSYRPNRIESFDTTFVLRISSE